MKSQFEIYSSFEINWEIRGLWLYPHYGWKFSHMDCLEVEVPQIPSRDFYFQAVHVAKLEKYPEVTHSVHPEVPKSTQKNIKIPQST